MFLVCEEITPLSGQGDQDRKSPGVWYGALPYHKEKRNTIKHELADQLVACFGVMGEEIVLTTDSLGCPGFLKSVHSSFSISFSEDNEYLWSAVAYGKKVGIDAEPSSTFNGNYPYSKVFRESEFDCVTDLLPTKEACAAFLWTCKEAVVKSIGIGFNSTDPFDVHCYSVTKSSDSYRSLVVVGDETVAVWSKKIFSSFVAIAWV